MPYLIMYDIKSNKLRSRIRKTCRKSYFIKLQKSVYIGDKHYNKLVKKLSALMLDKSENDHLMCIKINYSRLQESKQFGMEFPFSLYDDKDKWVII